MNFYLFIKNHKTKNQHYGENLDFGMATIVEG
jgi:hypothetical protein